MGKNMLLAIGLLAAGLAQAATSGTVVSTINAGSYTYVEIDIAGTPVWYAAPTLELKAGDLVAPPAGMPMQNFHSDTLDRTFDVVYFVDAIPLAGATAPSLPAGHPPVACPAMGADDFGGIEKADYSIGELYGNAAGLAGKQVAVRGKAVKVTNGIMGKNWVHLQDGTGEAGCNDLTVTTAEMVAPGSTVLVSGVLATNLDFGYGYTYAVLLQDAELKAE
jgi:hypothetical protein